MSEGKVLVVEDDSDISSMLRIYFESQDFEVAVAPRGEAALEMCQRQLPQVVVLDILLPDLDGYDVCRRMRSNLRTSRIPIIFLTQKDDRSDRIHGLELGADDYMTKPFDIEELKLRVKNAMARARRESLTNPTTGLPSGRLIEDRLRQLVRRDDWGIIYVGISRYTTFTEEYGFVGGGEVLRFSAAVLSDAVNSVGTPSDFIGHVGADDFIVITKKELVAPLVESIERDFGQEVGTHYDWRTRKRGYLIVRDVAGDEGHADLMTLSTGVVTADDGPFADILEITQASATARREGRKG